MNQTNNFAFKIATANGTGSASANGLIMQAIFRMGIPVTGKNVFPSNIQGLPTWYEIRVSERGYTARTPQFDLMVALNPATYGKDVAEVRSGGWLMYDSTWPLDQRMMRPDVTYLGVPLAEMCNATFSGMRERILMKNIAYAGVLSALLDIDRDVIRALLKEKYGRKPALVDSNERAVDLGYDYARAHFDCPLPLHLSPLDKTRDAILIDGNTAAALGCLYAGATVGAWYPITPATSLMEAFKGFCQKYRREPDTNRNRFAILQAEDEIAAIGMVIGASWAGARAFTPTAGPGISLMNEFIGLAYYAEVPAVIFDVQRTGPSTGMPTRTQQCDLMMCAYASHGDTRHICVYPGDPREAFEFAAASFDLAERFQTPVFVLTDLDIGMNDWMIPKLTWDDAYVPDRGKVLTRGTARRGPAVLALSRQRRRRHRRAHAARACIPRGRISPADRATTASATIPRTATSTSRSSTASIARFNGPRGSCRSRSSATPPARASASSPSAAATPPAWRRSISSPPRASRSTTCASAASRSPTRSAAFLDRHEVNFIVEQNRDGQLRNLLQLETAVAVEKLESVRYYGGFPMSAHHVITGVKARLEKAA